MASVEREVAEEKSPDPDNVPAIPQLKILKSASSSKRLEKIEGRKRKKKTKNKANRKHPPAPKGKENVLESLESSNSSVPTSNEKVISKYQSKKQNWNKVIKKRLLEKRPNSLPVDEAKRLLEEQDPENIQYIEGYIRIHPTVRTDAYIPIPGEEQDLLIHAVSSRNKALDGDLIVASINPEEEWFPKSSKEMQKTGTVICILERMHSRRTVGFLKCPHKDPLLQPRDTRIPLVKLRREDPMIKDFLTKPHSHKDTLFLVEIDGWLENNKPLGRVLKVLGMADAMETEREIMLLEHNIDISPYSQELVEELPSRDYNLTELDIKDREDWRQECVFTIDPSTAVDLDDAVSCKLLENGNYELGVHIADVTHFLKFLSPLDTEVAKRATTVYLTDNVYHMLPKNLCEVCSLLPGQEKLTFSVIWEISPEAEIVKHRFAKTVIKSCCQMSYDQAQMLIEHRDNNCPDDLVHVDGDFNQSQLLTAVNQLYELSVHLRRKRFANGALHINQAKLKVLLDKHTGLPNSYIMEQQQESNRLIEEFMLLANMTVASHLYSVQPETALLRSHMKPKKIHLDHAKEMLEQLGVHLSIESSASLEESIRRYKLEMESKAEEFSNMAEYRMMVINSLCIKAMARATYKCSSTIETEKQLNHYALNVPFYTHFTSPIRRYVDCVVHRLLDSSINGTPLPKKWTKDMCIRIAALSNVKKYNAKLAQDESAKSYFTYFVSLTGPFVALAIVAEIKQDHMSLILCQTGIKVEISYTDIEKDAMVEYSDESTVNCVVVTWTKPVAMEIFTMFTLAPVQLQKDLKHFRLRARLLPSQQQ